MVQGCRATPRGDGQGTGRTSGDDRVTPQSCLWRHELVSAPQRQEAASGSRSPADSLVFSPWWTVPSTVASASGASGRTGGRRCVGAGDPDQRGHQVGGDDPVEDTVSSLTVTLLNPDVEQVPGADVVGRRPVRMT